MDILIRVVVIFLGLANAVVDFERNEPTYGMCWLCTTVVFIVITVMRHFVI